jgi:UDP-2,3-diacylglucosamine pyrophosphatase LpxH
MKTLIVSDIHLGSRSSQAGPLSELLETDFDRLILNGDIINNLNLRKLKPKHWRIISQLRKIARSRELILIGGNHDGAPCEKSDFGPADVLAALLGVPLEFEYPLPVGANNYLVLHGHRFDPTLTWPIVTDAADFCYRAVQEINKKAAKWLKSRVKKLGGVIEFVKRRSVQYARALGYHGIITGHTHFHDNEWIDGIHYLNTGCWVDSPCTYIRIQNEDIRVCTWDEGQLMQADERPSLTDWPQQAIGDALLLSQTNDQVSSASIPAA